jgi:hypothetical protein
MLNLMNGGFPTRLGLHLLNTEERVSQTASRPSPFLARFRPSLLHGPSLRLRSLAPSIVGFGRCYLHGQVEGSLCMNFCSFHLGPREFSIQAH